MNTETANLTPEQSEDWKYHSTWYLGNGWAGDEARRLAWQDLCKKYPDPSDRRYPSAEQFLETLERSYHGGWLVAGFDSSTIRAKGCKKLGEVVDSLPFSQRLSQW